ncbi:hypothetical protein ACVI1J_008958 [Bradyrhizobium diazoefficiens]
MNDRYFSLLKDQAAGIPNATVRTTFDRLIELHRDIDSITAKVRADTDLSAQGRTKKARDELKTNAWKMMRSRRGSMSGSTRSAPRSNCRPSTAPT